jgi:hypothetical protein
MRNTPDNVLREFASISKYRVRLLQDTKGNEVLDIREFVQNDQFQGYTRRGIRLTDRAQMDQLRDILKDVLDDNGTPKTEKPARRGGRK